MTAVLLTVALALLGSGATALAGVQDAPLPTFSDGKASQLVVLIPTAIKNNFLDTDVICTNLAPQAVDIGLEVFDQTGTRGNSIGSANGAAVGVPPGATVTIGTGETKILHEDHVIVLEAPVTNLRNGSARVVATDARVGCVAFAVDALHTIDAPPSNLPPPALLPLSASTPCSPAACDDGNACTVDGCDNAGKCTHTPAPDGATCDDGNACTTTDACAAGVCRGTAVTCGADTPCHQVATCDPSTGQCTQTAPFSNCVPGGGKKTTDCGAEWVVENPHNPKGRTRSVQVCRQGDPSCDFDSDTGQCSFLVRVCLSNTDANLPVCTPGQIATYELRQPTPGSRNAETLLTAIAALAPSSRGGKRLSQVSFSPPAAATDQCTAGLPLVVPLRRMLAVKARATSPVGLRDTDKLKLKCTRKPPSGIQRAERPTPLASSLLACLSRPAACFF